MKHTHNQEIHTDFDSNLETIASSAIRSISPNTEHVHAWYTAQKPIRHTKSVRSKIYIPVFGSVFAGMCAFIMILSTQNTQNQQFASLSSNTTPEIMSFSALNVNEIAQKEAVPTNIAASRMIVTPEQAQPTILTELDSTLLATNRGSSDTFLQETDVETLNTLFE